MENKGKAVRVVPAYFYIDKDEVPHIEVNTVDFEDTLEWLQEQVGGLVEHYQLAAELRDNNIDCWINDQGKMLQLDPTFALADKKGEVLDYIAGPVIFTAFDEEGNTLPLDERQLKIVYRWLERQHMIGVHHYEKVSVVMKVNGFTSFNERYGINEN